MIRTILPKLTSHTTRREFAYRKEPYWGLIEYGRALGFLKKARAECYWDARCRTPEGGYRFYRLARTNQGVRANGKTIMTYTQARTAADEWFGLQEKSGPLVRRDRLAANSPLISIFVTTSSRWHTPCTTMSPGKNSPPRHLTSKRSSPKPTRISCLCLVICPPRR